ncbi:MAG: hypothetical protein KF861_13255 [Planctomycetaceae bacterium]|nr:hypothetical protein [Planctomycetaceae bacterium]
MRHYLMLCACIALFGSSVGCCWSQPCGWGGGCSTGTCGTPNYYGGGYPTGMYSAGTNMSAGIPTTTSYAYTPVYTTAGVPINSLPTY